MADLAAFHAKVSGRVQGVFFRAFVSQHARELGLTGWVRNLPEGSVEVTAEGERTGLEKLAHMVRQGPPASSVTNVEIHWAEYTGKYAGFGITR